MTRVAWTRLEGNDVEAVVAMFVNRERSRSTRITPSKGDGGVDILERNVDGSGLDVVYQVKRYVEPLDKKEKDEVEKSLKRLMGSADDSGMKDPRWDDLNVKEWHLVMPWDPTPEAEHWLQALGSKYGIDPIWDGLDTVEQYTAKYPDVVDYYLEGGRARIDELYKELSALFAVGNLDDGLDVLAVNERIEKALGTLSHDPHYRYEHRFGEGTIPPVGDRPGLVLSFVNGDTTTGRWTIVDVIARCAASTEERPITGEGTLLLEPGSDAERAFRDAMDYGAPFTSPAGAYSGTIDAPGGLGGTLEAATISMSSVPEIGDNPDLRLEVLDPEGEVLGAVDIRRTERTRGARGARVVLEEVNQVFTLETRFNTGDGAGRRDLRFGGIVGKPVAAVSSALNFLSCCAAPNVGRVSVRHTPAEMGVLDPNLGIFDLDTQAQIKRMAAIIGLLAGFQARTSTVITVPDLEAIPQEQINDWRFIGVVLRGEEATSSYPEGSAVHVALDADMELGDGDHLITMPIRTTVGTQELELGVMDVELREAKLVERKLVGGRNFHVFETPDRRVRHRLAQSGG